MSHSVYLSNISSPSGNDRHDILMMEWGYEMPLLLQPLLIHGGFVEQGMLYYDAKPGIDNLKRFYNFLSVTSIIHDTSRFSACRDRLFEYLDTLDHAYFCLDARELLDEEPGIWQADIAYNNAMISSAMDNHDIALLDYHQLKHVSLAFQSFGELLNYPDVLYGLRYIYEAPTAEIYNEGGLWGLKNADGEILLSPQFDEFYEFGEQDIAVVKKGQQYGYVHRSGKIVVAAEWDEAYDFDAVHVAIVQRNGLLGLIDVTGKLVAEPVYEILQKVKGYYIAKKDGSWGVLAADGAVNIDFKYDKIEGLDEGVFLLQKDGFYQLTEDGEQFDLIVRKAPPQGFAWAFRGAQVYLIDKYGVSRANKAMVQQEADSELYEGNVRERLLAYVKSPDEEAITDAYTPVEELYNIGVDAYNRQDYPGAIAYYTLAAEKGYGYAMNNLAHIYYMVDGYIDEAKAFYWYTQGAEACNTNAMNGLSLCYQYGIGTTPDIDKAIDLLQQAAEDGMAAAHNNLGFLLYERDPERALYHYQQAEALGEGDDSWLGYLYAEMGEFEKALRYYQQAIDKGNEEAHIEMARIYLFEEGFVDLVKAQAHITAAEKADVDIPDELRL